MPPKDINLAIPDSLNTLVLKCMAKEATDRYDNVKELMMDLQKIKDNPNAIINGKASAYDSKTIIMTPITEKQMNTAKVDKAQAKVVNSSVVDDDYDEYDEYDGDEYEEDDEDELENTPVKRAKETTVKKPRKSRKGIIIGIITIAILAIMVPLGMYFTGGAKEVSIPKIVGLSQEEAESALKKVRFSYAS